MVTICTQCKRQLRASPGDFDPFEPGTTIGTAVMACRTVSGNGPSESSLQVPGGDGRGRLPGATR